MDHLDLTLRLWRRHPFQWGQRDCMLSIGDYLASRGALDVTDGFRGTYTDEVGALAHMERYGGVAGLIDLTGVQRVALPLRGDVVALQTGSGEVGAICTGDGIAARLERGVVEVAMRLVVITQVWRVP